MESLVDFGDVILPPPPVELDSLFLDEDVDSFDENWWQEIALNAPEEPEPDVGFFGNDDGACAPAPSSSCSSPAAISTPQPDGVTESGTKRSAVSSPESQEDDPKRARRLEKNREAASQSRARKKSYVKELEVKCRMLEAHVAQLQRVMTVTSMENTALKDELVRVKKPKDGVKTGVAEPAVLESNSLPSEFLRHHSCHYLMGQQVPSPTAGRFPRFLLTLLQFLLLAAVSGSSDPHPSLSQPLREGAIFSVPSGIEAIRALGGRVVVGKGKKSRHRSEYGLSPRPPGSKRRRRVKRIRSRRLL
jgi:hypothetical protein